MTAPPVRAPRWVAHLLVPAANLAAAFLISGILVAALGEDPFRALRLLVLGAFGNLELVGFTLYYATNFIFTGLAVAVAFHCNLFNIGGEGQAYIGGLGAGLVGLAAGGWPAPASVTLGVLAAALFGAGWAAVPAWLQARRGSHVVITTIMFNFLAAALMTWLLVEVLIEPGQQAPQSREFADGAWVPFVHEALAWVGAAVPESPLNLSVLLALSASAAVWVLIWRTRWGYEIRTVGANPQAAVHAGISPARNILLAMLVSGGLAGLVGVNEVMGVHHRLILDFTSGFGFVGIAVALMGRNHPAGIFLAALLFGALYQGGAELAFDMPTVSRDMVVAIQGLVILFSGAMEHVFRPHVMAAYARLRGRGPAPRPPE